jgi:hypothetical protein
MNKYLFSLITVAATSITLLASCSSSVDQNTSAIEPEERVEVSDKAAVVAAQQDKIEIKSMYELSSEKKIFTLLG